MGSFATALYDALLSAGVAADRARVVADLFDRSVDERWSQYAPNLATKTDLAALATKFDALATKAELVGLATKSELGALATKVETLATKSDLAALATKNELVGLATKGELGALSAKVETLATKAELAALATKGDLAELRAKVAEDIAETNVRVARLETRIAETKSDLLKWMLAALTAQTALLLSLKLV